MDLDLEMIFSIMVALIVGMAAIVKGIEYIIKEYRYIQHRRAMQCSKFSKTKSKENLKEVKDAVVNGGVRGKNT